MLKPKFQPTAALISTLLTDRQIKSQHKTNSGDRPTEKIPTQTNCRSPASRARGGSHVYVGRNFFTEMTQNHNSIFWMSCMTQNMNEICHSIILWLAYPSNTKSECRRSRMTSHCTACRENNSITGSNDWQTTDEYTAAWAPHAPTLRHDTTFDLLSCIK